MSRTKLADRTLPPFSRSEELVNMATHIVGAAFGVTALVLCVVFAAIHHNSWGVVGGALYGAMMVYLYTISSVYHGLVPEKPKKVLQVLDHCSIYALIIGTYIPILFTGIREHYFILFVVLSSLLLVAAVVFVTFTAIDFKKYAVVSMTGYFSIGWVAIFLLYPLYKIYGLEFIAWLFFGGVAYTLGMIFFAKGNTNKYFHSIFHLFILLGSALHFVAIFKFCI